MPFVATRATEVGETLLASALRVPMATLIGAIVGVGLLQVLDALTYQLPKVARRRHRRPLRTDRWDRPEHGTPVRPYEAVGLFWQPSAMPAMRNGSRHDRHWWA